jgi:sigma-B regulation protein RsbU (phosphoserine phosphatase)
MASSEPIDQLLGGSGGPQTRRLTSAVGTQLLEYILEKKSGGQGTPLGKILIVDNDQLNRTILARNLKREGYSVQIEDDGNKALELLEKESFDLLLWEVQLPGLNGPDMLQRIRQHEELQHVPVVLLSKVKDMEEVIRCIEAGASDYLTKPFNPALLKARIRSCLERKSLRDQERKLLAQIKGYQDRIGGELAEAKAYLLSLLPSPIQEPFAADWRFIPSSELGGDCFGYHWIDDDHFALYLLDVSGHGVGAALLSVTALNVLRSHVLNGVDFRDPAAVLAAANRSFPMEQQNERYFTLWYGVYRRSTRTLTYSSGGHPPALLFEPGQAESKRLATRGMMIGAMPESRYKSESCEVIPGSRLFLFCDGAYEISLPEGRVYTFDEFATLLGWMAAEGPIELDMIIDQIFQLRGSRELEDDLSVIAVQF